MENRIAFSFVICYIDCDRGRQFGDLGGAACLPFGLVMIAQINPNQVCMSA